MAILGLDAPHRESFAGATTRTAVNEGSRRVSQAAALGVVIVTLGVLYWPGIRHHWEIARHPYFVPPDAVQYIPAFFKFDPHDSIPTTPAKEYYLRAICPPLYKLSFMVGARFVDVRTLHLVLTYFAYLAFLGIVGRVAWILGGPALCLAVLALTLSATMFFTLGFLGGAPRMYAYPLMSLTLYSLLTGRPIVLGATVVFAALLYPVSAVVGGVCFAAWMLWRPLWGQGVVSRWSASRRWVFVVMTASLTLAAVIPLLAAGRAYGRRLVASDVGRFPEAGAAGNYRAFDRLPYQLFGSEWVSYVFGPLYGEGDPIAPSFNMHKHVSPETLATVVVAIGLVMLAAIVAGVRGPLRNDASGGRRRLVACFVACVLLHVAAWAAAPRLYIPTRYLMLSFPFVATLLFPWALYEFLRRVRWLCSPRMLAGVTFLSIIALYLLMFGGRGNVDLSGWIVHEELRPLYDEIATLRKSAVIAGWPTGPVRRVEYVARRNAFVTMDVHQVLHVTFTEAMRRRMDALFDAYLATDAGPVVRLREEYGVTHLLVELADFRDPSRRLQYFAPWKNRLAGRLAEIKGREYLLTSMVREKAGVFNGSGVILLDIGRLP